MVLVFQGLVQTLHFVNKVKTIHGNILHLLGTLFILSMYFRDLYVIAKKLCDFTSVYSITI
jgi:hypothetical protein